MADHCKCKRGPCPECGSHCKRCGCDCDGTPVAVKAARKRGHRGGGVATPLPVVGRDHPPLRKTPRIAKVVGKLEGIDDTKDLWTAFGFTEAQRKSLPSLKQRREGSVPAGSDRLSRLIMRLDEATSQIAGILYPGDPEALTRGLAAKVTKVCLQRKRLPLQIWSQLCVPLLTKHRHEVSRAESVARY